MRLKCEYKDIVIVNVNSLCLILNIVNTETRFSESLNNKMRVITILSQLQHDLGITEEESKTTLQFFEV